MVLCATGVTRRARLGLCDRSRGSREGAECGYHTFLLNDHYAYVLFDTRADRSFVSLEFKLLIDLKSEKLEKVYSIEYDNGHKFEAKEIMLGCNMNLVDKSFKIDLTLIELKSFNVVVGMDWLSKVRTEIGCFEKVIKIPLKSGETLVVQGDSPGRELKIVSAIKMGKYLEKECFAFLVHMVEKDPKVKSIQDIPVVRDHQEVFPEDFSGPPSSRQVEFHIDLVLGEAPVAKAPYRLTLSETQEFSGQLQEIMSKGLIRPSSSH
ncbi:putative nucleotidyltransferase, ribonuclease H [Tanacetum coccineum]